MNKRKILAVILLAVLSFFVFTACDTNAELKYTLSEDGSYYTVVGITNNYVKNVIIPHEHKGLPVKEIGNKAFVNCRYLTNITIPDSITAINFEAFGYYSETESVYYHCPIEKATIPAFACKAVKNERLKAVVITSGDILERGALDGCIYITEFTVPEGISYIGPIAFAYCTSLKSITIPDSVKDMGSSVFYNCTSLERIYYSGTAEQFKNTFNEFYKLFAENSYDISDRIPDNLRIICKDGKMDKNLDLIDE